MCLVMKFGALSTEVGWSFTSFEMKNVQNKERPYTAHKEGEVKMSESSRD
jgi:hypothetical protein